MEKNKESLAEQFSAETLKEMEMESIDGGILDNNTVNPKCTNNCAGGNCPCTPSKPSNENAV